MPDTFTDAYIECAFWADSPEDDPYDITELAPITRNYMERHCSEFQAKAGELIADFESEAGHDFWLTRRGHGCGFWDGGWLPGERADKLTDLAHAFGDFELYRGDDGLIYASGYERDDKE